MGFFSTKDIEAFAVYHKTEDEVLSIRGEPELLETLNEKLAQSNPPMVVIDDELAMVNAALGKQVDTLRAALVECRHDFERIFIHGVVGPNNERAEKAIFRIDKILAREKE